MDSKTRLTWKVNTGMFLKEIASNPDIAPISGTFKVLAGILGEVAARASQLDDDKMNALMCRLSLYAIADQSEPEFDQKRVDKIMKKVDWA